VIVASVLIVQHAFAFGGKLTDQHEDLLSFWVPNYCTLGKALAHGHVPLWNPAVAGGLPFAADPQTGWGYLPAMLAFAALPCDLAMRWFLVLQPALGGVALYGFRRTERLGRVAATVGGLVLALAVGGSWVGIALPFAAAIASTAVILLFAARCLRARGWARRLAWAAVTAVAWGQLAAAYGSDGLAMGT
jgi:hypothetical protein